MVSRVLGPVLTIVCGTAFVALIGFLLHQQPAPALAAAPQRGSDPHHVYMHLSTYPDSMAGEHGKNGYQERVSAHPSSPKGGSRHASVAWHTLTNPAGPAGPDHLL